MAITSYGYAGLISPAPVWAMMQQGLNSQYFVSGCTIAADTVEAHRLKINTGFFGGVGVINRITAAEYVDIPIPPSGTKWYLVVGRQDFVGQATTMVAIDCGTKQFRAHDTTVALPTINVSTSGLYDVPLALVAISSGDTTPSQIIDLRLMSMFSGNYVAYDENVTQYANDGACRITMQDGVTWARVLGTTGGWTWQRQPPRLLGRLYTNYQVIPGGASGWSYTGVTQELYDDGGQVELHIELRRVGDAVQFGTNGSLGDIICTTVLEEYRPKQVVPFTFEYWTTAGGSYTGGGAVSTNGDVVLKDGTPNTDIRKATTDSPISIRLDVCYNLRRYQL